MRNRCFMICNGGKVFVRDAGQTEILTESGKGYAGLLGLLLQVGLILLGQFLKALEFGGVIFRPVALLTRVLGQMDEKVFLVGVVHFGMPAGADVLTGFGVELSNPLPA